MPENDRTRRIHATDSARGGVAANLAAIVVNYNGWLDTIACIVSLLAGSIAPRWIYVVDNASTNDSAERIAGFLQGQEIILNQPLPFVGLQRLCIRDHGEALDVHLLPDAKPPADSCASGVSIVFDITDHNGGFAAGNNIAIRRLAAQGFCGCIWLVNSDAYVAPDCVQTLVKISQADELPPIFGTVLVDYEKPERVQACGSRIFGNSMKTRALCAGESLTVLQQRKAVQEASYPVGASLLFFNHQPSKPILLNEDYFLYCEEADLVRQLNYSSVFIYTYPVVAHKGGAATGGNTGHTLATDYYSIRARILYAWADGKRALAATTLHGVLICIKRLMTGRRGAGANAFMAVLDGLQQRTGPRL